MPYIIWPHLYLWRIGSILFECCHPLLSSIHFALSLDSRICGYNHPCANPHLRSPSFLPSFSPSKTQPGTQPCPLRSYIRATDGGLEKSTPPHQADWSHLEFVTADLKRALHLAWQPCHIRLVHQLSHCSRHHGQVFLFKFLTLLPSPYFSMEILLLNQLKESLILGKIHLFSWSSLPTYLHFNLQTLPSSHLCIYS